MMKNRKSMRKNIIRIITVMCVFLLVVTAKMDAQAKKPIDEEEQLVLNDRTTEGDTCCVIQ